jgi:glycosyltransferase involved in cell wall biosynthesis
MHRGEPETVSVTAVVASRNEIKHIEACVRSLLAQQEPEGGYEIIVVDGMSEDGTRDVLERLAESDRRLTVLDNPRKITPAAFNAGIRRARGRYIAFMGAHARYPSDYLVRCLELAERLHTDNVGGPTIAEASSYVQRAIAASHHSPFSVGGASWHSLEYEGKAQTVYGGFYRRDVFDRIGLFDESLVRDQDAEFNFRLELAGGKIWQSPAVRSWYTPRSSLGALFRQYRQFGYFKVLVMLKHGRTPAVRQYAPAALVAGLLGSVAVVAVLEGASILFPSRGLVTAALAAGVVYGSLVLSYVIVLLVASVITAAQYGWDLLPILPATFARYHVGYGIGFLQGLIDFVVRRRTAPSARMSQLTR